MKKLLPLVAVLATVVVGCVPVNVVQKKADVKPVPVEEFTPEPVTVAPTVNPHEITAENSKEMCERLKNELDREK